MKLRVWYRGRAGIMLQREVDASHVEEIYEVEEQKAGLDEYARSICLAGFTLDPEGEPTQWIPPAAIVLVEEIVPDLPAIPHG